MATALFTLLMMTAESICCRNVQFCELYSSLFICPKVYTIHKRKINTIQKTGQGDCEGTVRSSSQAATLKTKLLFLIAGNSMVAVRGQS